MAVETLRHPTTRPVELLQRRSVRHRLWIGSVTLVVALGSLFLLWPVYALFCYLRSGPRRDPGVADEPTTNTGNAGDPRGGR